jgi:hypothetical protein
MPPIKKSRSLKILRNREQQQTLRVRKDYLNLSQIYALPEQPGWVVGGWGG